MLAKVHSFGLSGLDAYPVTIEVDVCRGIPCTMIVGLPDSAVKESKERVRAAIINSGFKYPSRRVTINLSPADVKKEGPAFDLAVALVYLTASGQINGSRLERLAFLGELSLDGAIRPVNGILSIAMTAPRNRFEGLVVPAANAREAALAGQIPIFPAQSLNEVIQFLQEPQTIPVFPEVSVNQFLKKQLVDDIDFRDVKGQSLVKRGLEIAAAGGHNVLMIGPPGSGKSMLAQRMVTILPDMTREECLSTTRIHSVMGLVQPDQGLITSRPFRSPHHSCSDVALIGGGSIPKPGEVSLSHNGILFLDELPEFTRTALESLRQPLEDRTVTVARAAKTLRFPARFMLVASMNPCLCGQYGNSRAVCRCNPGQIQKYRSKISGPLLDRIDIHLDVPAVNYPELSNTTVSESSEQIRQRVNTTRIAQLKRFSTEGACPAYGGGSASGGKRDGGLVSNAQMSHRQVRKFCALGKEENELLKKALTELNFSARAYDKILKVSRTIADLEGSEPIQTAHLAEAIQYRSLDRNWWG